MLVMLRGRQGFLPFVLAWAGIAVVMATILMAVLWSGGSFLH
jgi:hypothetical protein